MQYLPPGNGTNGSKTETLRIQPFVPGVPVSCKTAEAAARSGKDDSADIARSSHQTQSCLRKQVFNLENNARFPG